MSGFAGRPGLTDIETADALLDESRGFFSAVERGFDFFGFKTAADNLRRYRSGKGGTHTYTDEEIAEHPALLEAEDRNRTNFERATFTGRTGNTRLNARLLSLGDGETYGFEDDWQAGTGLSRPSTYFAFGRNAVASKGESQAHRDGDLVSLRGTVTHGFIGRERFDFNPGQPGSLSALMIEGVGEAAPFTMAFERRQDVEAEMRYEPDGSLTLTRATWGAIR